MNDESTNKFMSFFVNYGWLIYLLLFLNEKYGFPLITFFVEYLYATDWIGWLIALPVWIIFLILLVGFTPTLMGLVARSRINIFILIMLILSLIYF